MGEARLSAALPGWAAKVGPKAAQALRAVSVQRAVAILQSLPAVNRAGYVLKACSSIPAAQKLQERNALGSRANGLLIRGSAGVKAGVANDDAAKDDSNVIKKAKGSEAWAAEVKAENESSDEKKEDIKAEEGVEEDENEGSSMWVQAQKEETDKINDATIGEEAATCNAGHPLQEFLHENPYVVSCDICGRHPLGKTYRCLECNFDLCPPCYSVKDAHPVEE